MSKLVSIGLLIGVFVVLAIVNISIDNQKARQQWEDTLVPCMFNPETSEPIVTPCMYDGEVLE